MGIGKYPTVDRGSPPDMNWRMLNWGQWVLSKLPIIKAAEEAEVQVCVWGLDF